MAYICKKNEAKNEPLHSAETLQVRFRIWVFRFLVKIILEH